MRVTAQTKDATRKRILDVAQRQFARQGFDAATTREIAGAAHIAVGTLFNYFPTKESIVLCLISEACAGAEEALADTTPSSAGSQVESAAAEVEAPLTLEEELFAHVALLLRKLKPYRKYLPAVLETSLSPLATDQADGAPSLRAAHLEIVGQIVARHGHHEALSAVALQLYWTLYTGVLAFWAKDASPRQEDTLALLDQSLGMFASWLTGNVRQASNLSSQSRSESRTWTGPAHQSPAQSPRNGG